jgi:hypothetical protein
MVSNAVVELSLSSDSKFLITSNTKDYIKENDIKFSDLNIVAPAEFVKLWRSQNEK